MAKAILVDEAVVKNIGEICEWVRAWVDYYIDDKPVDDIEETDAQHLNRLLPIVERFLNEPKNTFTYDVPLRDIELDKQGVIFLRERKARESVNPNYRYCVVDSDISECWLTDDIGDAMQKAHTLAVTNRRDMYYVLKIEKAADGTYKTWIDGWFDYDGEYMESRDGREYLHFNFIAERVGKNMFKIQ